jgi:hypothetical protein
MPIIVHAASTWPLPLPLLHRHFSRCNDCVRAGLLYLLDVTTQFPVPRAGRIREGGGLYPAAIA